MSFNIDGQPCGAIALGEKWVRATRYLNIKIRQGNKYKYKYKYREIECPEKELSSVYPETAHQKHVIKKEKKEEYKNRLPALRERNEFSAPLLTTDHQKCGKGGKQGTRNIVFFLQSFLTRLMITKV